MDGIPKIDFSVGIEGIPGTGAQTGPRKAGPSFEQALEDAIASVDAVQRESETLQVAYARGEDVDLHDVLIKIEEAEIQFKTMMEVRNKLLDAYREIMRMSA